MAHASKNSSLGDVPNASACSAIVSASEAHALNQAGKCFVAISRNSVDVSGTACSLGVNGMPMGVMSKATLCFSNIGRPARFVKAKPLTDGIHHTLWATIDRLKQLCLARSSPLPYPKYLLSFLTLTISALARAVIVWISAGA
jgi:hypothetical protein